MDRVRATRFGIRSVQHLESLAHLSPADILDEPLSAAVIGVRSAQVLVSPMETVERRETDWKNRRPKEEFWMGLRSIVDTLSGRNGKEGGNNQKGGAAPPPPTAPMTAAV